MGDCLRAGKPSPYATSRLTQLSLLSFWVDESGCSLGGARSPVSGGR